MSDIIEILVRSAAAFILLLIVANILGKQTITRMTYHDFIASIILGSITANMIFNVNLKFVNITTALIAFSTIVFFMSWIALLNRKARKWINGEPTVLIENGKILEGNMKKIRYTLDSLNQGLREKEIFNIEEVEYATLEADGHLSVLKKPQYRNVTKQDLEILTPTRENFPLDLIMDGKIIEKNVSQSQFTLDWLNQKISEKGLSLSDISYAVIGTNGKLFIDLYQDNISSPIDKENGGNN